MTSPSKDKRNQLVLVAIGTLVAIVGVWQVMVVSQKKSLEDVRKRVIEQQTKLDNAQRLLSTTAQIQKNLEAANLKLKAVESEMASGDMYSWIIQTVNKFREGYKVDIPQFSREVPCEVGMFTKFPYRAVQFNVRGTAFFHDFGRFLADFENRFPYMRVQNLELEPAALSNANLPGTGNAAPATSTAAGEHTEKLAFRMEIVALVNPLSR
jgi:hypothetical protein